MSIDKTSPPAAAVAAAEAACVFGYPLVLMDRLRTGMHAPPNRLVHAPAPEEANPDMLGSSAWLDLAEAPIVLSVPATFGHYYVATLLDMWTEPFASVGPRTTGTGAGSFAIGGPSWTGGALPSGVLPLDAPTSTVRLVVQTYASGDGGMTAARAVQAGLELRPLGARQPAPAVSAGDDGARGAARAEVGAMDGRTFFAELGRLVAEHPPPVEHRPSLEAARRLGLLGRLDARSRAAADEGVARALAAVDAAAGELVEEREGRWRVRHPLAPARTDYLHRAATARAGLAETPPAEELCASARTDDQGFSLSGRHRYLLRFPPDALPPAHAFWSLSARATGNPGTRRYAVGNPDGLLLERDGSLPIHIQCDPPGSLRAPNWLPTPPGAFDVVLRLFWPTDDALQRRWSPPAVTRVG